MIQPDSLSMRIAHPTHESSLYLNIHSSGDTRFLFHERLKNAMLTNLGAETSNAIVLIVPLITPGDFATEISVKILLPLRGIINVECGNHAIRCSSEVGDWNRLQFLPPEDDQAGFIGGLKGLCQGLRVPHRPEGVQSIGSQ